METKPIPEVETADVEAVRKFLTSLRNEERKSRAPSLLAPPGLVPLRNGIARARQRSLRKTEV